MRRNGEGENGMEGEGGGRGAGMEEGGEREIYSDSSYIGTRC